MQIKLYMSHFTHDRVELDETAKPSGGWLHGGMSKPTVSLAGDLAESMSSHRGRGSSAHLYFREEDWGGLIFDTRTNSIYQSDKDAFSIFDELRLGNTVQGLVRDHPDRQEELLKFEELVNSHGLL